MSDAIRDFIFKLAYVRFRPLLIANVLDEASVKLQRNQDPTVSHETALAFSVEKVAQISGLGRTLIFAEIKIGRLAARKCGRRTLVLAADLHRWLDDLPTKSRDEVVL
jgi:hypothetical protein